MESQEHMTTLQMVNMSGPRDQSTLQDTIPVPLWQHFAGTYVKTFLRGFGWVLHRES